MTAFWQEKSLSEMTSEEWESLCDGCGRCCLRAFQDDDDGEIYYSSLACYLFDNKTCQCTRYQDRQQYVPECQVLSPETPAEDYSWMPKSCAYRRLHEGRGLAEWHPLVSGDPKTVIKSGISVRGRTLSENLVPEQQWQDFIIDMVET